jgi:RNase H-fold protein (predicted Holliday junction resolvase)
LGVVGLFCDKFEFFAAADFTRKKKKRIDAVAAAEILEAFLEDRRI